MCETGCGLCRQEDNFDLWCVFNFRFSFITGWLQDRTAERSTDNPPARFTRKLSVERHSSDEVVLPTVKDFCI